MDSVFGQRFGIHFVAIDGAMYGRSISGEELLLCYSVPKDTIPEHSIWSRFYSILDSILPGNLPFRFVNIIAFCPSRLGVLFTLRKFWAMTTPPLALVVISIVIYFYDYRLEVWI